MACVALNNYAFGVQSENCARFGLVRLIDCTALNDTSLSGWVRRGSELICHANACIFQQTAA